MAGFQQPPKEPIMMPAVDNIAQILKTHWAELLPEDDGVCCAVALLLRDTLAGPEVLLVQRATFAGDPWSGNVGFPGGKVEDGDGTPRLAAERETLEEVGVDLSRADFLGFLAEIPGAHLPVRVSCFVYRFPAGGTTSLNGEIVDAFWVRLADLADRRRHCLLPIPFGDEELPRPGIVLPQPAKPFLWGLTYRLVMELLQLLMPEEFADSVFEPSRTD